jgi:hypothetical protein
MYLTNNAVRPIFYSSLLLGIGVLLNLSYLAFFGFLLISINIIKPFNLKEHLISLIAFTMPLYIGTCLVYLFNGTFLPKYISFPDYSNMKSAFWMIKSPLSTLFVIILFAMSRMYRNYIRNNIKTRRAQLILIIFLLVSFVVIFTGVQNPKQEISFISLSFAVYLAYYFTDNSLNWFKEILNVLYLAVIVAFQYDMFFTIG